MPVIQGDQRLPHDSGESVSTEDLRSLGVLYFRFEDISDVDKLALERGYKNRDEVTVSPSAMGDSYEDKVKMFFNEHLHEDEEIRYIKEGHGYFDVRGSGDKWVRIQLEQVRRLMLLLYSKSTSCT
jgi:1,2-dihydroxy-3-keto-5-methylthiopentene dioxygenase